MTDVSDILNMTFDDVPADFEVPSGEYSFEITRATVKFSEDNATYWYDLRLKPIEVLSEDAEVTDEDLENAFPVRDRMYYHTTGCKKWTKKNLEKILGDSVKGLEASVIAEALIGQVVRARVENTPPDPDKGRMRPQVDVKWYYAN